MPFVKLDCDMLESSLWDWTPERHIFITALLMAKPFELKEPQPQLEADSLNPTRWIVPPGKYGMVNASGVALIKKALTLSHVDCLEGGVDVKDALAALNALGQPDEDSRSQAFDGRRLVRIDGGYIVLNYQRFRDKDHTATERKKLQRQRDVAKADNNVPHDEWRSVVAFYNSTCAYCESAPWTDMEHVLPLSRGGTHDISNVVPSCHSCHERKKSQTWEPKKRHPFMLVTRDVTESHRESRLCIGHCLRKLFTSLLI